MTWRLGRGGQARAPGLLAHPGFRRLWAGQTVSVFGSEVTALALPLAAVLVLHASTFQVGLLTTATYAAFLGIGLPAGAWVDRLRRRPVMIAADLLRAAVLVSIPVAAGLGRLTLVQLYLVALVHGVGTVFFDVAYMSYLPGLVGRDRLVGAYAKLEVSQAVVRVSGPSFGGVLVGLLTAPVAFLADTASFLVSVASLGVIRDPEPAPEVPAGGRRPLAAEVSEGLRFVLGHPILRMIAGATSTANFFGSAWIALSVVFLVRQVGLSPSAIGALTSAGAAGGVLGALVAVRLARTLGSARVIWVSLSVCAPFLLLLPLTFPGPGLALWAAGTFADSFGAVVYNVNQASYRQLLCPPGLLGRMNATMRFIVWGTLPLGALVGGALGGWLGNRSGLWVAVIGSTLSPLWLVLSPLRGMRDVDTSPGPGATDGGQLDLDADEPVGTSCDWPTRSA
ncbi:MAG: MFS transporter [Acidimicrobiales bacterium]